LSKEFNEYKSINTNDKSVKLEIEELSEDTENLVEIIKNRDALILATTENYKFLENKFLEYSIKFDTLIKKNHHYVSIINKLKTFDSKYI